MTDRKLTPQQRLRLSGVLLERARKAAAKKDRGEARKLAQRAIDVLPDPATEGASRYHGEAEAMLRDLAPKPPASKKPELVRQRLTAMWHPTLNGKRFEDLPRAATGQYWWLCVENLAHGDPFQATTAHAAKRWACPVCARKMKVDEQGRRRRPKGPHCPTCLRKHTPPEKEQRLESELLPPCPTCGRRPLVPEEKARKASSVFPVSGGLPTLGRRR